MTQQPEPDWTPEPNDPAFEAGYNYVAQNIPRADGYHGIAPWWYGWMVRTAFWAGVKYAREEKETPRYPLLKAIHAALTSHITKLLK